MHLKTFSLERLPIGECDGITMFSVFSEKILNIVNQGPAAEQTDPDASAGASDSCVLLPDQHVIIIQSEVQNIERLCTLP